MNVTVRRLASGDRAFVEDLGRRTVMGSVPSFRHAPEVVVYVALERLLENVEQRSHVSFVAESAGERAGFVLVIDDLPDEITGMPQGFVAYMAVEPAFRRNGVGRALLDAAEDEARRLGLPYMTLMVTEENAPARALYRRAGYITERRLLCKPL